MNHVCLVESYLAIKYGITLPGDYLATDGSTIWDATAGGGLYQNDIIVIGRDDAELLYQKQSHTKDDSLQVFVDVLAADNNSNVGTITNDISYLVIGHNGGKLLGQTTELPSGIYSRFTREWKITNTNFDDDFSLEFEWEEFGAFDINDIRLLVDADGDFSNATVLSTADGLTFTVGSIIVGGIGTSHIPAGSTRFVTVASASSSTPLPIRLLSFTATPTENSSVKLDWATASETDNDFFTVERSRDGRTWNAVKEIAGAGNSSLQINYTAVDTSPYYGLSYYRLKQTDFDGQFSYSQIRSVSIDENLALPQITIYPNPSSSLITIEGEESKIAESRIYNIQGQDLSAFIKVVESKDFAITLDISNLQDGIYILKTKNTVNKVIKQ